MLLVCGEALIDLFVGHAAGGLSLKAVAGGSPFNVALGLARLGRRVGYVGALSTDAFGDHLAGALERDGVRLDHAVRLDAATTLSVVSSERDGTVRYAFHGEGCADRLLTPAQLPASLDGVDGLTFGSYSLAVEPSGATFEHFAVQAAAAGRVISFDPNVRPSLIGDWEAWRARFRLLLQASAIVKASEEDVLAAFGEQTSLVEVARDWRALGPSLVVITRGAEPAIAVGPFGVLEVPSRETRFVDAVGAGDSFHAALLAALDRRGLLERAALAALDAEAAGQALGFAAAAAAVTCARTGADLPRLAEIEPG